MSWTIPRDMTMPLAMPILPAQCRAARGLLAWSQEMLAKQADVGLSTVRDLETERREISAAMATKIRTAFERAGVVFLDADGGGPGVRLRRRPKAR